MIAQVVCLFRCFLLIVLLIVQCILSSVCVVAPCSIDELEILVLQKKLISPIGRSTGPVKSEKFTAREIRARTDKFACFFRVVEFFFLFRLLLFTAFCLPLIKEMSASAKKPSSFQERVCRVHVNACECMHNCEELLSFVSANSQYYDCFIPNKYLSRDHDPSE